MNDDHELHSILIHTGVDIRLSEELYIFFVEVQLVTQYYNIQAPKPEGPNAEFEVPFCGLSSPINAIHTILKSARRAALKRLVSQTTQVMTPMFAGWVACLLAWYPQLVSHLHS